MPSLASWLRRALGGKRKIYYLSNCPLLRRGTSAVNRGMTHFYRKKSRETGKNPAGVLSQNVWNVEKLRHRLGHLGWKRDCPDMLPIITWRKEIVVSEGN